jgi:uncharacterized protein YxjI
MRQQLFRLGDDYLIRDSAGRETFYVDGKALSFGSKLSFQDMNGRELAWVEQKLFRWGRTFEIQRDGETIGVLRKQPFTFLHARFTLDVAGPNDLEAVGSLLDREYVFTRSGRRVAEVSKRWFDLGDTYGIDIEDGEDDVMLLAAAVVVDQCCHEK